MSFVVIAYVFFFEFLVSFVVHKMLFNLIFCSIIFFPKCYDDFAIVFFYVGRKYYCNTRDFIIIIGVDHHIGIVKYQK